MLDAAAFGQCHVNPAEEQGNAEFPRQINHLLLRRAIIQKQERHSGFRPNNHVRLLLRDASRQAEIFFQNVFPKIFIPFDVLVNIALHDGDIERSRALLRGGVF